LVDPELIPAHEREAFEYMLTRIQGASEASIASVRGEPYGLAYFSAMAASPVLGQTLSELGTASMGVCGKPNTLSKADHEMIDAVLALDSGYTFLLAAHAPLAIHAGVRPEALVAIREGRENDLTDDERQQVEFIRAVPSGTMTDEIWESMAARLGSERGVVEYAFFVCLVLFHHLFACALGVPDMSEEELDALFDTLSSNSIAYRDYEKLFGEKHFGV
jgi:hypothetical protein